MTPTPPLPPPASATPDTEGWRHHFKNFSFISFSVTLVITIILCVVCAYLGNILKVQGLWMVAIVLMGIYILESFQTIKPGEIAALVFFGKPYKTIYSGPVYVPLWIVSVIRDNGRIIELELPAEPEFIWRGTKQDENAPPPEGSRFKPPIRILFGPPDKDPKFEGNPYNAQIVAEVPIFVSYQITCMIKWTTNMGSHEKAAQNIEDMAIALFNIEFSTKSPAAVVANLKEYSKELRKEICENTETWGITVRVARIKPIIFSHDLNKAVTGVSEAQENAKSTRTNAGAERDKRTEEGQGLANARLALLEAEAKGLLASLTSKADGNEKIRQLISKSGGLDALQLETIIDALKGGNNTFLSGGDGLTQSLIGAFQTAMNTRKKEEKKDD